MSTSAEQISDWQLQVLIDEASPTVLYVGDSAPGSAASDAVWRIYKIVISSGLSLKYADGNTRFDNIWDNRSSLTY